jgi:hypothetical protein
MTGPSEKIDLQACEHCGKEYPIETMHSMSDCWFCYRCTVSFEKAFDACDHKWSPHVDAMGNSGQHCERCSGFVTDEAILSSAALDKEEGK